MWDAAARHGVTLPATCHQGWCLTCAARVQDGTVDQRDSIAFFQQDYDANTRCFAQPSPALTSSSAPIERRQCVAIAAPKIAVTRLL
jgi:ferredoxin